ncbi:zinc knuckle CX2CX4HX4C containing protein [Tanacetum coccineum]
MDNVRDIAKAALDERMLCLKGLEAGNAGFTMPSMDVRVLPNPNMGEEENDVAVRPSCPRNHDVHNGAGKSFVTSESLFSNQVNLDFAGTRPRHTHSVATHEMGKHEVVWSAMTCEQHQDVMDAIFTKWKVLMAENPSELNDKTVGNTAEVTTNDDTTHMDNSLIIQSVIIQDQHRSYVGAAGGSKPEPNKSKENFHCCGILCTKQLGQIWFNSNNDELQGFLFFQFKTSKGLEDVLENGPWMIQDGLSIIASQIGKPIMLDSYTSPMCIESWGRSSFAGCLIEINANDVLKESLTMGVPIIDDPGFTIETVSIEYEWKPPRCDLCRIFGHDQAQCPKKVSVPPTVVTPTVEKTNDGFQTVGKKKKKKGKSKPTNGGQFGGQSLKNQPHVIVASTKEGNITMSNSYAALDDESDEDVENVYDESANLLHSTQTGESSSTSTVSTVAAG